MSQQTIKQQARRSVRDVAQRRRREQLEREQRLEDLAVQVVTAIAERDAAVADSERRAGRALREMVDAEHLSLAEAVEWCNEQVSLREATRLRRLVASEDDAAAQSGGAGADTTTG